MNPSVSQMKIFSLLFQCIGRLHRGHLTSTKGGFILRFEPKKEKCKLGSDS